MLTPGSRLGPYEVLAPIGAGGMGEVWRARDQRLKREVAIKVLPDAMVESEVALSRFEREARAVAALSHPNVLAIHDFGNENGVAYAVMELLEGTTLRERLTQTEPALVRALEWAHQIAQGLSAAHERGIVHRDLKPENIFLTRDGLVKILDFGLALVDEPANDGGADGTTIVARTGPGTVMGTVGYFAPEQARGETVDARSDIFAFGVVFYEMLAGKPAFLRATAAETIAAILREDPKSLSERGKSVPAEVEEILSHCLEKQPDERFRSARDLAFAIRLAMRSSAASGSDVGTRQTPRPSESDPGTNVSIAVLPFRSVGTTDDGEYFSDGITEEIINSISNIPNLQVAARSSSFAFKGRTDDVRKIGRELGVGMVLEGSIRQLGARLRVSAQLINVESGYQVWSDRWDRELADVFAVQDEIAQAIATAFKLRLAPSEGVTGTGRTQNVEAYDRYLKGRYLLARRRGAEAIEELQEAADRDPEFGDAHTALAEAWAIRGFYGGLASWEAWARGRAAVDLAERVAPASPNIALARAILEYYYGWDLVRQQAFCTEAIERNPKSAEGYNWMGLCLALSGRRDEALEYTGRGIELEPYNAIVRTSSAWAHARGGDFATAARVLVQAIELAPDSAYALWSHGNMLRYLGRYEESAAVLEKLVESSAAKVPFYIALLGGTYGAAGERSKAGEILALLQKRKAQGEFVPSRELASVLVTLGRHDEAMDALEKARDERNAILWSWIYLPEFTPLRPDPRWQRLAQRLGRTAPVAPGM